MDTCPACRGEMIEGQWAEALPLIQLAGGGNVRVGAEDLPAGTVCPTCSLLWFPPEEVAAPAETARIGRHCPECGRATVQGYVGDQLPEFSGAEGRLVRPSGFGSLQCAVCPECGLVHLPGKNLLLQTPITMARERYCKARGRAEIIISNDIWCGGVLGAVIGAGIAYRLAIASMRHPLYPIFKWMIGLSVNVWTLFGLVVGGIVGAGVGAWIVLHLRLPTPWREDD